MKCTLLAWLDSENHPSLHKEVPRVSFPVTRTVVRPAIQGMRIALPILLILRTLEVFSFVLDDHTQALPIRLQQVDNLLSVTITRGKER